MHSQSTDAEIHQMAERMVEGYVKGDLENFLELFTDDIVVMPPGHGAVEGKPALRGLVKGMFEGSSVNEMMIEPKGISVDGDVATVWGLEATISANNATGETSRNHYNIFWTLRRGETGEWGINRILWNPNPQEEPDEQKRILRRRSP